MVNKTFVGKLQGGREAGEPRFTRLEEGEYISITERDEMEAK
jgi:hypothetical protein